MEETTLGSEAWNLSSLGVAGNWSCEPAPTLTRSSGARAAVLAAMALLSLLGNAATIASIRRRHAPAAPAAPGRRPRGRPPAVYALILHLSAADLLVTAFCLAGEAAWSYAVQWLAGDAACRLFKFAQVFSLYLSTFVLVLIGVDRFAAVRYPMRALAAAQRLGRLVAAAWLLSALLSLPQLVIFHVERGPFCELFLQCVTYGFYTEPWQEQLYAAFSLTCMFLLPLAILIGTYVSTFITISRSERAFRQEVNCGSKGCVGGDVAGANRRRLIRRAKASSALLSLLIVAAFVVCWTPYYSMMVIFLFLNPDKHLSEDLQSGIFFFGMSNSLVNPIIYGVFHLWRPRRRSRSEYRSEVASGTVRRSVAATPTAAGGSSGRCGRGRRAGGDDAAATDATKRD